MLLIQTKRKNEAKQVQQKQQIVIACSSPSIKEHVFFLHIFHFLFAKKWLPWEWRRYEKNTTLKSSLHAIAIGIVIDSSLYTAPHTSIFSSFLLIFTVHSGLMHHLFRIFIKCRQCSHFQMKKRHKLKKLHQRTVQLKIDIMGTKPLLCYLY